MTNLKISTYNKIIFTNELIMWSVMPLFGFWSGLLFCQVVRSAYHEFCMSVTIYWFPTYHCFWMWYVCCFLVVCNILFVHNIIMKSVYLLHVIISGYAHFFHTSCHKILYLLALLLTIMLLHFISFPRFLKIVIYCFHLFNNMYNTLYYLLHNIFIMLYWLYYVWE